MLAKNVELAGKTILVTGAAGFIGSNLVLALMKSTPDIHIIGIDSLNDYYDVCLKCWMKSFTSTGHRWS